MLFPKISLFNRINSRSKINDVGTKNEQTRFEWVTSTLKKIPAGSRILDAGAGQLRYKPYCDHLNYVSQDFAQYDGKGDNKGLQVGTWDQSKLDIICDIVNIPEPDASFDAIMCIEVLEHLPNPTLAIKEFSRLLKKNGYLILTAPFCSLTHMAPYHFYSGFNKYFYDYHLNDYGFDVIEMNTNGNYFEFLAQELRRLPSVSEKCIEAHLTANEYKSIDCVLKMLQRFSNAEQSSDEFLCFGYQVFAQKK